MLKVMDIDDRTLQNFSVVIPGRLAGMAHPGTGNRLRKSLKELISLGINGIVTLTERPLSEEILSEYPVEYLHLPIPDFTPPTLGQADRFVQFVDHVAGKHKASVVHCAAGIGRTGTMLACYLVKTNMEPEEAIRRVRSLRPPSIETPEQESFVYDFSCHLEKKGKP